MTVFSSDRSAARPIETSVAEVLLPGTESGTAALTVAELVSGPCGAPGATCTVTSTAAWAPAASVPSGHEITLPGAVHPAALAPTNCRPAGSGSEIVTPGASPGPALVTPRW